MTDIRFAPCYLDDASALAELRARAMKPSLEAIGRFDPVRVRNRFLADYTPEDSHKVLLADQLVGFFVVRHHSDHLYLDHLYVDPDFHSQGIGQIVLEHIKTEARSTAQAIRLGALRGSRANRFYRRHGFTRTHEEEFDIYYQWLPTM